MKEIEWEKRGWQNPIFAEIGSISLHCYPRLTATGLVRWYGRAWITKYPQYPNNARVGGLRHTLGRAQEDAVRLAHELLLDYRAGLDAELKNFDLLE